VVLQIQYFSFGSRGGGLQDKTLLKDEVEAMSSSWLNGKEV
jgi:hypothetical protein